MQMLNEPSGLPGAQEDTVGILQTGRTCPLKGPFCSSPCCLEEIHALHPGSSHCKAKLERAFCFLDVCKLSQL